MLNLPARFDDLKGKSVWISGGGSGIGEYLTEGFISQGCKVAFVQRSDATAVCDRLEAEYGNRPLFIKCDVTDIPALKESLAQSAAAQGSIDVLVNNAAWDNRHTLDDLTVEGWNHMMSVNLRHHYFATQAVAPAMREKRSGSIINYSSISYMMGNAGYPSYTAAKSAINGMTRSLARELGPHNIRVNTLSPGWVITQRQKDLWVGEDGANLRKHLERQCLPSEIPPEAMVCPTLFLASDASSMMTGQALVIDGGVVVTG
jgi:NAD(P)-dependent dehydrogenase (short-subunit alcohol dehydrogenase family)